jgi:hypothetical protein
MKKRPRKVGALLQGMFSGSPHPTDTTNNSPPRYLAAPAAARAHFDVELLGIQPGATVVDLHPDRHPFGGRCLDSHRLDRFCRYVKGVGPGLVGPPQRDQPGPTF